MRGGLSRHSLSSSRRWVAAGRAVHCGGGARRGGSRGPGIALLGAVRGADCPDLQLARPQRAYLHRTPSLAFCPPFVRPSVCLSLLPWGAAAGENHGVRSRYTCTFLFHQVSRRGAGKGRKRTGRRGLSYTAHLSVLELLSVSGVRQENVPLLSPAPPVLTILAVVSPLPA